MKRGCFKALVIVVAVLVLAAGVLYGVHRRYYGNIYFNSRQWKALANAPSMSNPRKRMYKDLLRRYLQRRMTRHEVRNLLGKPDVDSLSRNEDSYSLGVWGFMSVDATCLDVYYDDRERVVRTEVVEH